MLIDVTDELKTTAVFTFIFDSTDADYKQYVRGIATVFAYAPENARPAVLVCDPDLLHPRARAHGAPTANQRTIIAEGTRTLSRPDGLFCLVTRNLAVRGVLTAIHWIRPATYEFKTFSSLEAADTWLLEKRPGEPSPLAELRPKLYARINAELAAAKNSG